MAEPVSVEFSSAAVIEDVSACIGWTDGCNELPALGHEGSGESIAGPSAAAGEEELGRESCESTRSGKPGGAAAFPSELRGLVLMVDADSTGAGAEEAKSMLVADAREARGERLRFDFATAACRCTAPASPRPRAASAAALASAAAAGR